MKRALILAAVSTTALLGLASTAHAQAGAGQAVYATYITPQLTQGGAEQTQAVVVVRSMDGGRTWTNATVAIPNGPGGTGPDFELPTIAVKPGATPSQDRIVVAARETARNGDGLGVSGDAAVAISNDGGATWSAPVAVDEAGENANETSQPVIGPDGAIFVAYRTSGNSALIRIARRDPNSGAWGPPRTVAGVTNNSATSGAPLPTPNAPNFSSASSFPRLAIDPGNGNLYIVYNQSSTTCAGCPTPPNVQYTGADHFIPPDSDVYFQRSLDDGTSWTAPKIVNEADPKPGNESPANPASYGRVTQTRHPNVYVAPNGRVDIVWQDRRHWYRGCIHTHIRCDEARLGDTYYAYSDNADTAPSASVAFSKNRRISDRSQNNDVGTDYRYGAHWAFGPVAAHQGNNLIVAWMDSREGDFDNDNLDIYLAKVNHNGVSTVPQETLTRTDDPVDNAVRLSRHAYPGGGEGLLAGGFASRNGTRVVIVNQADYPAILASGVLARANLSQVFVSPAGGLPASVRAEIARLKPAGAYIIGDTTDLSAQIVTDLVQSGVAEDGNPATNPTAEIERIEAANDAALAAAIANELDRRTSVENAADTPAFNAVAIVNPASPDSAAIAGLAAARRLPILFVNQSGAIPAETLAVLNGPLDIDTALVIGGTDDIGADVFTAIDASVENVERLGGADQYATSRAVVAESLERGLPDNLAYVADGSRPIDGALLGPAVGRVNALMILAPAPLSTGATSQATATNIAGRLDRMILFQPAGATVGQATGSGVLRVGKNYRLTHDPASFRFKDMPAIAVNPRNANHVVEVNSNNLTQHCEGTASFDGGTTWSGATNFALPAPAAGTGGWGRSCRITSHAAEAMYQTVAFGSAVAPAARGGGGGTTQYPQPAAPFADCPTATANIIRGTAASNSIVGTPRADRIFAGTGDDTVDSLAGNDCIDLGPGTDRGQGGSGHDLVVGGLGRDRLAGSSGNDRLRGGSSADRLIGGFGNDRLHGQSGSDRINGERGRDRINGGSSNDVISAGSSADRVAGDQGNDRVSGNSGNDSLKGNSGRDRLSGGSGRDRISGGSGNDRISARDGQKDRVNCGSGRDSVTADSIDVLRNCERIRRSRARSSVKSSAIGGLPALVGAAYLGLLGWRRRS